MRKAVVCLLALACSALAAETYRVTFFQKSLVNGQELKPGEYKLVLDGDKVTVSNPYVKVESAVKVEPAESKFNSTSVRYQNGDGKFRVREIRLGGSSKRLVFDN